MKAKGFFGRMKRFFSQSRIVDEDFLEALTDELVEGDMGALEAYKLVEAAELRAKKKRINESSELRLILKELMLESFADIPLPNLDFSEPPLFLLMLGVNGVGKTTSAAKLAALYRDSGKTVYLAAADTFRAAAVEQLKIHGERLSLRVIAHPDGKDPAAVIWDALEAAKSQNADIVIADSAGRMHTKQALVEELKKIVRVAEQKVPASARQTYLVVDATSGRNALSQAEVFAEAINIDGLILSKYDTSARGGIAWTLAETLKIPTVWICNGESYKDIKAFNPEEYVEEFLGLR